MSEQKRKRGAQPGNKNAAGNRGGKGGPVGNKYAVGKGRPKKAVAGSEQA